MLDHMIVKFGRLTFKITDASWSSKDHHASVLFENVDTGVKYHTIAWGMTTAELHEAVFDAAKDAWVDSQAQSIAGTAEKLNSTLEQLALACGNHPFEDGPID